MRRSFSYTVTSVMIGTAVLDFLCLVAALHAGYWLWVGFPWHGNYQPFEVFAMTLRILPPLGILIFMAVGLYKPQMGVMGVEEQSLIFKGIWILYFLCFALSFFYRGSSFSRLAVLYSMFVAIFLVSTERYFIRHALEWCYRRGIMGQKAMIYGAGYHGQRLERWIRQSHKLGIKVVGFLDDNLEALVKKPEHPPCLGGMKDLPEMVRQKKISMLFIAHRNLSDEKIVEIFQICRRLKIECWVMPALYKVHIERVVLTNIGGIPLVGFREGFVRSSYLAIKRILDFILALMLTGLLAPLGLLIAMILRLMSSDPVFFYQKRAGKDGKYFTIIKFRTLRVHERREAVSPELRKEDGKSTSSGFQRFLRRTGLDEIPQIFNVLRGDMSLIGPRPEMPFIVRKYGPLERERLTIKPGITGLWQISEDRKRLLIHENMDYDLYYIEHLSFNLDLAILFQTFLVVFKRFF